MNRKVVIIGAGMGGLSAAVRLAQQGFGVRVFDSRPSAGGLASSFQREGLTFDAGPYVILDRPGLEWAFQSLRMELDQQVKLRRIEEVFEVSSPDAPAIRFFHSLDRTAAELERNWPGSGPRYQRFVQQTWETYQRLQPLQRISSPGAGDLIRVGAWRDALFLLRSLHGILARTGLPLPVIQAIGIWTHVAGQQLRQAPSPLALVPAIIHRLGAYYAVDGIGTIPAALQRAAVELGVEFHFDTKVKSVRGEGGRAIGVELEGGEFVDADAVVSNYNGVGTYLELVRQTPPTAKRRLQRLPLQSPGVCAYLAVRGEPEPPYLRFRLLDQGSRCHLLIAPSVMQPDLQREGWRPARLLSPMSHDSARDGGEPAQRRRLERLLADPWWREQTSDARALKTMIPRQWGQQHCLYQQSMNPVMTARFMRSGRLAHRSPHLRGLYLVGSSTHPGQWVSFAAISGILAADRLREDEGEC